MVINTLHHRISYLQFSKFFNFYSLCFFGKITIKHLERYSPYADGFHFMQWRNRDCVKGLNEVKEDDWTFLTFVETTHNVICNLIDDVSNWNANTKAVVGSWY